MKTSKRSLFLSLAAAFLTMAVAYPGRLSAETPARWSVQVSQVNAGATSLAASFQAAIYEDLLQELSKTKRFDQVLREGDHKAAVATDLLVLKMTVEKYSPGSETRRAVTTVTGWTKVTVRTQLTAQDGKVVFDGTEKGNVRFFGSNLRVTHNLARSIAKAVKKSSLPEPPSAAVATMTKPSSSDDVVVVEFR